MNTYKPRWRCVTSLWGYRYLLLFFSISLALSLLLGGAHCGLSLLANTPESGYSSSCYSRPLFKAAAQFCTTHVSVALIQPYLVFLCAFPCFDLSSPFAHRSPDQVLNFFPSICRTWVSLQSELEWRGVYCMAEEERGEWIGKHVWNPFPNTPWTFGGPVSPPYFVYSHLVAVINPFALYSKSVLVSCPSTLTRRVVQNSFTAMWQTDEVIEKTIPLSYCC